MNAVSTPPSLKYNLDKQTNKQIHTYTKQQLSFNNIAYLIN